MRNVFTPDDLRQMIQEIVTAAAIWLDRHGGAGCGAADDAAVAVVELDCQGGVGDQDCEGSPGARCHETMSRAPSRGGPSGLPGGTRPVDRVCPAQANRTLTVNLDASSKMA
jgi:hypothetical protein